MNSWLWAILYLSTALLLVAAFLFGLQRGAARERLRVENIFVTASYVLSSPSVNIVWAAITGEYDSERMKQELLHYMTTKKGPNYGGRA